MEELVTAIFKITVDMERALKEEKDQEFEQWLTERNTLMQRVEEYKSEHPLAQYSPEAKRLLEASLEIDRRLAPVVAERLSEAAVSLNQFKNNKQVSKKYQPYMKQTSGVFVDSKK